MNYDFAVETILGFCEGEFAYVRLNRHWEQVYLRLYSHDLTIVDFESAARASYALQNGYVPTRFAMTLAAFSSDVANVLPILAREIKLYCEGIIPMSAIVVTIDIPAAREYYLRHEMASIFSFFTMCMSGQHTLLPGSLFHDALKEIILHLKPLPEAMLYATLNARDNFTLFRLCLQQGAVIDDNLQHELACIGYYNKAPRLSLFQ